MTRFRKDLIRSLVQAFGLFATASPLLLLGALLLSFAWLLP